MKLPSPTDTVLNKMEKQITWLHLTDLHIGRPGQPQRNAMASLIASISETTRGLSVDLVLITGDLAYSGKQAEYLEFEQIVLKPLQELDAFNAAEFVCVPGNHDLDCDEGLPIAWQNLGVQRQSAFFQEDAAGRKIRASRASGFRAYVEFVKRNSIISVDPTNEVVLRKSLEIRGQGLELVLATTCFFSDKDISDEQKAPAPVPALRPAIPADVEDRRIIVLGHHPVNWFLPETARHLNSLLLETRAIYVNGHEHEIKVAFSGRGLTSLGFGASYQNSIDAPKIGHYRNSYALCELNDTLNVKVISWDHEHGRWNPDPNLPADFNEINDGDFGGYRLSLPTTKLTNAGSRPYGTLAAGLQQSISLDRCVWLASDSPKRWSEILTRMGLFQDVSDTFTLSSSEIGTGHFRFRVRDKRGSHLVHAISAAGGVLTHEQLQSLNTELDTQGYASCHVVTLGSIASDASTLATQLQAKKPITVVERDGFLRNILRKLDPQLKKVVGGSDPTKIRQWLVMSDADIGVLRQDRAAATWFDVLDGAGRQLPESDPIVRKIRQEIPELLTVPYGHSSGPQFLLPLTSIPTSFVKSQYLSDCYDYFDDVKYAPLAAIGLRFRNASLSEIYVNANADANESAKNNDAVARAVDEFLDSLQLPTSQRDQLQAQLRAKFAGERSAEVGAASQLYQRFGNVVVLGDPGSGKTCFVKHEILAYCRPAATHGSWYSNHLPVYLSLAEAARLIDEDVDLPAICETTSARRGIPLPRAEILRAISSGQAAFFFDGLDEVGSTEKRSRLMTAITSQIELYARSGNRFVIASRPAAVQPLQLPAALKYLHLRGLSEEEMRVLAGRVLTVRLGEEDAAGLTSDEAQLVERLIEDTRASPGIARIARNPLLLTLLVLIYANTGAVSTHRHVIYTQAIKTLISVRGRETRREQISESDLRVRLGSVALAIFRKEIAEIPRRSEVRRILAPLFGIQVSDGTVDDFLQDVAEATGLLRIHPDESTKENDLITFMHYSFLEYYAAAGIIACGQLTHLADFAGKPRWKEVITLLFGIMSEQSDVTPSLRSVLEDAPPSEAITNSRLLLALDCAAECDVPPIDSQAVLVAAVNDSMRSGAGRASSSLRQELADRIGRLIQGGATSKVWGMFEDGLLDAEPLVSAAFADLVASLPADIELTAQVKAAFARFCELETEVTPVVAMQCIERRRDLRVESARNAIYRCLKGNIAEKHAALSLVKAAPTYYASLSAQIELLLDDKNDFVANSAARCILYCDSALTGSERASLQERVLMKLNVADREDIEESAEVTIDTQLIESMLAGGTAIEKELALRYTPVIKGNAEFIHRTLIVTLRTTGNSRHQAAAMDALRAAPRALALLTIADTDVICSKVSDTERNVRIAAIKLLGEMPDDEQVQLTLLQVLRISDDIPGRETEVLDAARAIAKHSKSTPRLRSAILELIAKRMPRAGNFGSSAQQSNFSSLLQVTENFTGIHDSGIANALLRLAEDFRTPELLRRHSLKAYGRLSEPSAEVAEDYSRMLSRKDVKLNDAVYASLISFLAESRRGMSYIRKILPKLEHLKVEIASAWKRELRRSTQTVDGTAIRDLRQAASEIEAISAQYDEFSERATVRP